MVQGVRDGAGAILKAPCVRSVTAPAIVGSEKRLSSPVLQKYLQLFCLFHGCALSWRMAFAVAIGGISRAATGGLTVRKRDALTAFLIALGLEWFQWDWTIGGPLGTKPDSASDVQGHLPELLRPAVLGEVGVRA